MKRPFPIACALAILLAASCSGDPGTVSTPVDDGLDVIGALSAEPVHVATVSEAVAVDVDSNGIDAAVAWTTVDAVMVAPFEAGSGQLGSPMEFRGTHTPFAHPLERPALAVRSDGTIDVAWTALDVHEGYVLYSSDGAEPRPISGEPSHETNMVHLTLTGDDRPVLSWLEDSTLSVATDSGSGLVELESVDDLTCDCCNPAPSVVGDSLVVAYRDFDMVEGEVTRNVVAVRSADGGASFEPPIPVADDDWLISGCPFSGPSIVETAGDLVVAWMDARQSVHADQAATTIWVDRSTDGGATFGTDLAVAAGGVHRWPVMAVDGNGVIHLVWETQGIDGGLSHASSADAGRSFTEPRVIVDRELNDGGPPVSPSVVAHGDRLIVTWADSDGGYVGVWALGD